MSQVKDKVVLITGASSGIGEATARVLSRKGARVVLGARRTDRLKALTETIRSEGGIAEFHASDVTKLQDVQGFVDFGLESYGRIDVIVNNAGVMPLSKLEELKVDEWNRMIDVNIRGVLHGIAATLPIMKKQGFEHIINLSSIGGHAVHPTSAVYSASKFAVIAISEGLRLEDDKLRVTIISPGVTESELADSISAQGAREAMKEFRRVAIPSESIGRAIAFALSSRTMLTLTKSSFVRPRVLTKHTP